MITSPAFAGKTYGVFGLARSGLATEAALTASGATVWSWDDIDQARWGKARPEQVSQSRFIDDGIGLEIQQPGDPVIQFAPDGNGGLRRLVDFAATPPEQLAGLDAIIVSPGVPHSAPIFARAAAAGVAVIGDIELFARARASLPLHRVVGITGTNGKSTVTALIHHVLTCAGRPATQGGNIGLPILAQDPLPETGVYVLELSSFQLELTHSLACDIAILLNITPDHLDRHGSLAAYAAAKARLFTMLAPGAQAIVGALAEADFGVLDGAGDKVVTFIEAVDAGDQSAWPGLQGPHNLQNARAAVAACTALGLTEAEIADGLASYRALPHRMERIGTWGGVLFVNDSKATNPESAAPALAAFPRTHWIAGGRAKVADLDAVLPYLGNVVAVYLIGEAAPLLAPILAPHVPVVMAGTLAHAVAAAAAAARPGDTVLLSPACASYDQFRDFEARGDAFRASVAAL